MDEQQQNNHDRNLKIAKNEAKRELISEVRVSSWAVFIAVVIVLAVLTIYFMRK